ncbi:DRTGG domain-containing protein [Candidatus Izimaplasma bacterium HR1]|jgi:serine kinase of HPr protein (carbohydrate metabolism regulator)|uniref:DRTGG domain-containing protein n=1 Tax=Candidatus Izimoplasma sp. HR1 TaxID=1541959 RepID=UPI00057054C3
MKVNEILQLNQLRMVNEKGSLDNEISGIFTCDLLSHVMGHAKEGNALITVLNNINVLGVASLLDLSCVIFTHDTEVNEDIITKANELEIPLFVTDKTTYEITIYLYNLGI